MEKTKQTKTVDSNTDYDVIYHSKLLNKNFNSLDVMRKEEDIYKEEHAKELKLREEKTKDANVVKTLFDEYMAIVKECESKVSEAGTKYKDARRNFIQKYGYYHQTWTDSDSSNNIWDNFSNFIYDIFNKL